jgi:hypothetical protein
MTVNNTIIASDPASLASKQRQELNTVLVSETPPPLTDTVLVSETAPPLTDTVLQSAKHHRHSLTPCYSQRNTTATHWHRATVSETAPPLTPSLTHSRKTTYLLPAAISQSRAVTSSTRATGDTHAPTGTHYATPVSALNTPVCWHRKLLWSVWLSLQSLLWYV